MTLKWNQPKKQSQTFSYFHKYLKYNVRTATLAFLPEWQRHCNLVSRLLLHIFELRLIGLCNCLRLGSGLVLQEFGLRDQKCLSSSPSGLTLSL